MRLNRVHFQMSSEKRPPGTPEGAPEAKKRKVVKQPVYPRPSGVVPSLSVTGGLSEVGKKEYAERNRASLEAQYAGYLTEINDKKRGFNNIVDGTWPSVSSEEYWICRGLAEGRTPEESKQAVRDIRAKHEAERAAQAERQRQCAEYAVKAKTAFDRVYYGRYPTVPDICNLDELMAALRQKME